MVREQIFFLKSSSRRIFGVTSYLPAGVKPKAIIQIIPGMAEHAGRYKDLSLFFVENGYGVFIADHPGAGITAGKTKKTGIVPSIRGWEIMLENIRALYTHIRKEIPEAPVYIFGHSMGSILARHFTAVYPVYIQGLVLSGSFETPDIILNLAKLFTWSMIRIQGSRTRSKWFNRMFYKNLNRRFRKGPTNFQWISSIQEEVNEYVSDPFCGYDMSWGFYKSLFTGISAMKKAQQNLKYRKTLALLNICGKDDPVGNFGKDAIRIHRDYFRQRFQNNTVKIFPGRHELLHDLNKGRVYVYLLNWFEENLRP